MISKPLIPEDIQFECLLCGACCKNLIEVKTEKLGLFLLPSEISLFPEKMVSPGLGFDKHLDNSIKAPEVIVAYQFSGIDCPHYKKDIGCQIYSKRPLVCKAFPISIGSMRRKYFGRFIVSYDKCCSLKRYKTRFEEEEVRFQFSGICDEAINDLKTYFSDYVNTYSYMRLFDLRTFEWREQIALWY
jgi:Fe-S-cluster containining protein